MTRCQDYFRRPVRRSLIPPSCLCSEKCRRCRTTTTPAQPGGVPPRAKAVRLRPRASQERRSLTRHRRCRGRSSRPRRRSVERSYDASGHPFGSDRGNPPKNPTTSVVENTMSIWAGTPWQLHKSTVIGLTPLDPPVRLPGVVASNDPTMPAATFSDEIVVNRAKIL